MLINFLIALITFLSMEVFAWLTHKYIMHGLMWNWHKSHHTHHKNILEKNDLFAVCFSLGAMAMVGLSTLYAAFGFLFYVGMGITVYGVSYFIFHDVIVHRRIRIKFQPKNRYLQRIIRAHYAHHRHHNREGGEAFGFLYAPSKYDQPLREPAEKQEIINP